jgi:hypothetical protein
VMEPQCKALSSNPTTSKKRKSSKTVSKFLFWPTGGGGLWSKQWSSGLGTSWARSTCYTACCAPMLEVLAQWAWEVACGLCLLHKSPGDPKLLSLDRTKHL